MNNVNLIGRIATDLELKGSGDVKVVNFNLAVERFGSKEETDFIPVTIFGKTAENIVLYQGKGSLIGITGSLRQDNYTDKDGNRRSSLKVIGNRVQFLSSRNKQELTEMTLEEDDMPF